MIQMRPQPGTKPPAGSVWASPQRDIAHSFPEYARKALILAQDDWKRNGGSPDGNAELCNHAAAVVEFIKLTVGTATPATVKEAAALSGVLNTTPEIEALFGRYFWRVVMSAYWAGARQAYTESEIPLNAQELAATVDELTEPKPVYERALTEAERGVWGVCPVCYAPHGKPCGPDNVFVATHVERLAMAPTRVRLVAAS